MRKAKEDHAFTKTKGGGVKESGHHRGILMNKEAQDRLAADYARASVDAEYAASYSRRVKEQTTKYFADVGVLSDGDSTMNQPYNAKTSGAVDPTKSEEPSYLTKQIQMDSTIADSSNGAAHTAGHSSKNVSVLWVYRLLFVLIKFYVDITILSTLSMYTFHNIYCLSSTS